MGLFEGFEYLLLILLGNTGTGIPYCDIDEGIVNDLIFDADGSAARREFDRIAENIDEDLQTSRRINGQINVFCNPGSDYLKALLPCVILHQHVGISHHAGEGGADNLDRDFIAFDPGDIKNILDQAQ